MVSLDSSHYPSVDDITFESLEYLFGPVSAAAVAPVPWVEIDTAVQNTGKDTNQYERKILFLEQQLQQNNKQLQRLCILIGYMQGLLHEKDVELKALPDLRFKAGLAVARGLEAERAREKIGELEGTIERLNQQFNPKPEEMLKALLSTITSDDAAISILMWLGLTGLAGVLFTLIFGF